jgi:hypothetical protein
MQPKHWLDWPLTLNARGVPELIGVSLGSYRASADRQASASGGKLCQCA